MTARRVAGVIGRALIGAGLLLLLFVAYQLWGTGLQEARAQDRLKGDLEQLFATTTTLPDEPKGSGAEPVQQPDPTAPPEPIPGEAVALLRIPDIGLDKAIVEGVGVADLKKGPGHYPGTPMPGQSGNAAIAGHRTTYGQPFYDLDDLEPGDEIEVTTAQGAFTYEVEGTRIVEPHQTEVLAPTDDARLTLTTCHPKYSARQRLIVTATLVEEPAPAAPTTAPPAGEDPGTAPLVFEADLSGDRAAAGPTVLWGLACALVGLLTWLASRRVPKVPVYLLGGAVFLVVLFVFFENVARLLPANI